MKSFSSKVKITLLKGMEALGTTASNLASNAKLKVNEINLETRRREILTDFSLQAFELWQKGVQLPQSLSDMLTELSDIDNRLSVLRAQKYAKVNSSEPVASADVCAETGTQTDAAETDTHADETQTSEQVDAMETGELAQEVEATLGADPEMMPMQEVMPQDTEPTQEDQNDNNG